MENEIRLGSFDDLLAKNFTTEEIEEIDREVAIEIVKIKEKEKRCERYRLRINTKRGRFSKGHDKANRR